MHYLELGKGAGKAYSSLGQVQESSLKFVLRNREILCVLNAQGNAYV
ncbi:MAG: hypothetical protein QOG92_1012 [Verrucomicrobiota bacterium]|nr:hypothetical protein [Verrucomicrobiota bacterium]